MLVGVTNIELLYVKRFDIFRIDHSECLFEQHCLHMPLSVCFLSLGFFAVGWIGQFLVDVAIVVSQVGQYSSSLFFVIQ